jgi:DNA-binding transcriptional LysR family regulator
MWLNTFRTLIDVGHFTQTAEKLYMTQPGVSQQIKKLENACGHDLIKREGKGFELTEQGRLVYQYALKLAETEKALIENLSFDNPQAGRCKLASSGSLSLVLYPALLSLQQKHTDLSIHLEAAPNQKILNDLQDGGIDLGIVTYVPNNGLFQYREIGREELCLVLPKRYENKPITPDILQGCGLIKHPDAHHYLSLYFELCGDQTLVDINIEALPSSGYVNQLNQILLPVAKGLGFTVIPRRAIDSFAQKERLTVATALRPVNETLYLVQKRHRDLPARYQTISDLITQTIS